METTNKHHVLFPRKAYQRDPVLRQLRSRSGLIVVMNANTHTRMHRAIDPPRVLNQRTAQQLAEYLDLTNPTNEVEASAEWFDDQAHDLTRALSDRKFLNDVCANLMAQLRWIRGGYASTTQQEMAGSELIQPAQLDDRRAS